MQKMTLFASAQEAKRYTRTPLEFEHIQDRARRILLNSLAQNKTENALKPKMFQCPRPLAVLTLFLAAEITDWMHNDSH